MKWTHAYNLDFQLNNSYVLIVRTYLQQTLANVDDKQEQYDVKNKEISNLPSYRCV